jgi:tetratricopeptide (TPR) repeat protein
VPFGVFALVAALVAAGCRDPEVAKQQHLSRGNALAARGNYADAILEYRNAIKNDARFGEARLQLAEALARTAKPVDAAREYLRAAELLPTRADLQVRAGVILLGAREFERAGKHARAALAVEPKNVDAHIVLANALVGLKDAKSAVAELQEAIQLAPEDSRPYTSLGTLRATEGNRAEAEAAFLKAVEIAPKSVTARAALAYFYWSVERLADAEKVFKSAIAIDRDDAITNRMLATFYMATRRLSEAETPLLRLVNAKDTSATLTLADLYLATGRPDSARPLLETLKNAKETRAAAIERLAPLDYINNRQAEAHQAVDEVLKEQPNAARLLALKARWYLGEHRLDDSLKLATQAVAGAPDMASMHYTLGLVHMARNEVEEATKAFTETLRLNPRVAAAEIQLSRLTLARGDADKALVHAESARKSAPRNLDARLSVANALFAKRDFARAQAEVTTLRAEYPQSSAVHTLHARLLMARSDTAGAISALDLAMKLDPDDLQALYHRLAVDLRDKRIAEGRDRLKQALARNGTSSALLVIAARFEATAGDLPAAERYLRQSIDADSSNLDAYGLLAALYLRQNRLDEGRTEFEKLAARRPDNVAYKTMVGMIFEAQRRPDDAMRVYEEIVKATSGAPVAANNLAYHYVTRGERLDEALELAQRAKRQMPDRHEVNDTLGWIYYKKNLPTLAIPPLESSVEKAPENPLYQFHLGLAYAKAGRSSDARRALELALKLKPDFDGADEARSTLAFLKG